MSSHIRARKHKANQLATLVTLAFPAAALAQQAVILPEVKVEAQAEVPYKAERLSSSKQTQPILDIPQVVNVIKKEVLQEQGATSLMEALRNTPGITQQLGENGNTSAGDTFQMRGFSTQNSTFVDGVRDMGAVTRDVFNYEQVEVVKGPSGGDIGRGASSGYINLVTKQAGLENFTTGALSWNTGNNTRATLDANRKVNDDSGFRLNAMVQGGGVAGRNEVENNGYAIAPSFVTGLGSSTRVYVYGQFVRQDNVPDGGIPGIGLQGFNAASTTNAPLTAAQVAAINAAPAVNSKNFYGSYNDYEKVNANMVSARVEHDISSNTTLRNTIRWGRTTMDRLLSSPNTLTAANLATLSDPASWTINLSRQRIYQENEIIANQTALTTELELAGMKHSFAYGLELMRESQYTPSYASTTYSTTQSLYAPSAALAMPIPGATRPYTDGTTTTIGAYLFDTIELSKQWLFNAGLRLDRYKTETSSVTEVTATNAANYPGYSAGQFVTADQKKSDTLASWKLGLVYKPVGNGSIYVAAANSMQPPGGGSFNLAPAINSTNNPGLDPQETRSYEVGTKWDVLNKRLNLSVALYRMEAKNELAQATDNPTVYSATGMRVIQGVELGAVGQLTDNWNVSAGIATLDTEIKEGTSGNSGAGAVTRWSPDLTATLWTTYNWNKWSLGGGARYVSEQKRVVDPTVATSTQNGIPSIPGYSVFDAMVSYKLDKNVTLRLNVYNLTDKEYISTLNNGGNRVSLGLPRSATVTAQFQF